MTHAYFNCLLACYTSSQDQRKLVLTGILAFFAEKDAENDDEDVGYLN